MPSFFLTFRCRHCQQGRCVSAVWWDIRAVNELKDKDSQRDVLTAGIKTSFWYRGYRDLSWELSPIERMELDEEELREFGLDE